MAKKSRSIFLHTDNRAIWDVRVTSEMKDPDDIDAKAIASAVMEVALDADVFQTEAALAKLKGNRTKQATAQRKELKARLEAVHAMKRRLHQPEFTLEILRRIK